MNILWKPRAELITRLVVSGLLLLALLGTGCAARSARVLDEGPAAAKAADLHSQVAGGHGAFVFRASQVALVGSSLLDLHSTRLVLATGGREANAVMGQSLAQQTLVKGATLVPVLWLSERLERRGHRKAATVVLTVVSVAYSVIAMHNYKIAIGHP